MRLYLGCGWHGAAMSSQWSIEHNDLGSYCTHHVTTHHMKDRVDNCYVPPLIPVPLLHPR